MIDWHSTFEMIRRCNTARGRIQSGHTSLEGTRLVERASRAGIPIPHVLISERFRSAPTERASALLADLVAAGSQIAAAPNAVLEELTEGRGLGEILAVIPLPPQADVASLAGRQATPLFLAGVAVVDAGNVGALVRTAHGLGAAAFLAVGRTDPAHPRAVRTSMGSLFKLPVARFSDLAAAAKALRPLGIPLVGAVSAGGIPLAEAWLGQGSVAVVVGGEYHGLSATETALLDAKVTIPMSEGIDSLSVNAAAAVLLYEAGRQLRRG
jgi:TrmH family RNA methyltransferase